MAVLYRLTIFCGVVLQAGLCFAQHSHSEDLVKDAAFKDACGPFSCVVALRLLGIDSSLQKVGKECSWSEGEPVRLKEMEYAMDLYDEIECKAASLNLQQLSGLLADDQTAVILAIRKNAPEINHAVCAVSMVRRGSDHSIKLIDYPEFEREMNLDDLINSWDGDALIVRISFVHRVWRRFWIWIGPVLLGLYILRSVLTPDGSREGAQATNQQPS